MLLVQRAARGDRVTSTAATAEGCLRLHCHPLRSAGGQRYLDSAADAVRQRHRRGLQPQDTCARQQRDHLWPQSQVWKFDRYAGRLERIAADIAAGVRRCHYAWWGVAGALCALPAVQRRTLPMLTPAVNVDKCIACGICKDVCPQDNITFTDSKAHCGNDCTQCLACVHFCPQQAVELNRKPTLKDNQYHHPKVKVGDMQAGA